MQQAASRTHYLPKSMWTFAVHTWHHIPEDRNSHNHISENLKSNGVSVDLKNNRMLEYTLDSGGSK
jgi:hypothetical protein